MHQSLIQKRVEPINAMQERGKQNKINAINNLDVQNEGCMHK